MRIAIDLQGAQAPGSRHRGIGRYSVALTRAIIRNRGDHDVHLVLSGAFPESVEELRGLFSEYLPESNIHVWEPLSPLARNESDNLPRRRASEDLRELFIRGLKPDVVYITSLFEGMHDDAVCGIGQLYVDVPTCVTLYDLIPLIHSHVYLTNPLVAAWYMERVDNLRRADACLAISESAREEVIAYLGMRPDQVVNVGTAADPPFRRRDIDASDESKLRERYGIDKPFVMYTGGIDFRKNVERLIEAYALLPAALRKKHQLAIVCSVSDPDKQRLAAIAETAGLGPHELVMTGFVPEEDLIALYNLTTLFVFPSLHEGFGLPALEAMHCGAPVIASNRSSLPEVVNLEEALFDPFDEKAIAAALAKGLEDDEYRARLKANSERQANAFSWDESARRAIETFERVEATRRPQPVGIPNYRPRLAYVSPLPPAKSGIANYSADLLPHLSKYYDIDLIVRDSAVSEVDVSMRGFGVVSETSFRANHRQYERIVYQFGNSDHHDHMFSLLRQTGGIVVLHDFFLSGILAHLEWTNQVPGIWAEELYLSHGYQGPLYRKQAQEETDALWHFPCSRSVVEAATNVIVHSEYSLTLAKKWYGNSLAEKLEIVPHLREAIVGEIDKARAREQLGLGSDDFIVCSFGFISPTKLSQNLLEAWAQSKLSGEGNCKLIFVGENHPGDYGQHLEQSISDFTGASEVSVAGWTDNATFRTYLAAADIAVQLRTLSRGETSGAVLDCMNFGLPLIVNANGSMAEISTEAAMVMPEEFATADLSRSLEKMFADPDLRNAMGRSAKKIIVEQHSPATCAQAYMNVIEHSAGELTVANRCLAALGNSGLTTEEVGQIGMELASLQAVRDPRLLVDVSEIAVADARSGIQRVVRNILVQLLQNSNTGFRVEPVYTDHHSRQFRYARKFTASFLDVDIGNLADDIVDLTEQDTLLFLDLNPVGVPILRERIARQRTRGTRCIYVVYDLIALKHPEFFLSEADVYYRKWVECVAEGSAAICISNAVASDLRQFLDEQGLGENLQIRHFPLGSDLDSEVAELMSPSTLSRELGVDFSKPTFLVVGTIEPRKKQGEAVDAFEKLWANGIDINLCIVGRQGWMVDDLVERMRQLHRRENRFFWKQSVSDEVLNSLYEHSSALIAASVDEGFGLPLVEGASRGLHLIARDIPAFREVCGSAATYFTDDLAHTIEQWLAAFRSGTLPDPDQLETCSWEKSTEALIREIGSIRGSVQQEKTR